MQVIREKRPRDIIGRIEDGIIKTAAKETRKKTCSRGKEEKERIRNSSKRGEEG